MNKTDDKTLLTQQPEESMEELELFGRSKTREEIKAEEKARKKAELDALYEARRLAKEAKKAAPKELRRDLLVIGIITLLLMKSKKSKN